MTNLIKETLENGDIYEFDLDVCNAAADQALEELLEKEGEVENFDFVASVFSLFVASISILTQSGWTTDELINEVMASTEHTDTQH
jgi:hypothetical protein